MITLSLHLILLVISPAFDFKLRTVCVHPEADGKKKPLQLSSVAKATKLPSRCCWSATNNLLAKILWNDTYLY